MNVGSRTNSVWVPQQLTEYIAPAAQHHVYTKKAEVKKRPSRSSPLSVTAHHGVVQTADELRRRSVAPATRQIYERQVAQFFHHHPMPKRPDPAVLDNCLEQAILGLFLSKVGIVEARRMFYEIRWWFGETNQRLRMCSLGQLLPSPSFSC